jgi:intraflagellar transport protein 80
MRLQVTPATFKHSQYVTGCGWVGNELYTCSDDKTVHKVSSDGEDQGKVTDLDSCPTDLHWFPSGNKRQQSDQFAMACSDGSFLLVLRNGRVEKKVDAHKGAVIALRWSNEGTAIGTAGEDGVVKIWSRSGMLRSTLATVDSSVYSLSWSPDSSQICFTCGKDIIIKPLQPQAKQLQWKAHDGTVLRVDWNPVNGLLVSGGEDRKYKLWDGFGRLMFQSKPLEFAITSAAWSPNGELFAVGMYDSIRLCDRTGWTYSREQVLDRREEWQNISVLLKDTHRVLVHDILGEMEEELDFRDRVINLSIGYGHLVVTTSLQCCIYSLHNLNTPHIFDLKETVNYVQLSDKYMLMVDTTGMNVYTYEGRPVASPKFQGMRAETLNSQTVAMGSECLAVIDHADPKVVRIFEASTGKELGKPITHVLDVVSVSLNRWGSAPHRKCVIIDRNRDLYVCPVGQSATGKDSVPPPFKLGAMCDAASWNTESDMLAAIMDGKLVVWYYPNVVFVDRDLVNQVKFTKEASELGKDPQILHFHGTQVTVRRNDGTQLVSVVSPYPAALYGIVQRNMWTEAIQLCRYVKDSTLWTCLAVMALADKELSTAEVAFAAIDEVAKLQYVLSIKEIPTVEGRNAELALWRRRPEEAEQLLLQAGLIYRCIDMHIRLFRWDRALELAVHHKTHVDTVLMMRERYLEQMGRQEETNQKFRQYREGVEIDYNKIMAKIEQEKEKEASRPGAKPYQEGY